MYCLYQLRDPQNTGATYQMQTAFNEAEYNAIKASTPSNLEIHRIMLTNVSVTVDTGAQQPQSGGGSGGL